MTIQIQTRHVRDDIIEQNPRVLHMDWKIKMFDYKGIRTARMF